MSNPFNSDKRVYQIQKDVDEVQETMSQNLDQIVQNLGNAQDLQLKTDELKEQSKVFSKRSRMLKTKMWWRKQKVIFIGCGLGVVILTIIVLAVVL